MSDSYLNIIVFLVTTIVYYLVPLKPSLTLDIMGNPDKLKEYYSNTYLYLGIYFMAIVFFQFIANASIISMTCGGSITENIAVSGTYTFIPWLLIFGVIIIVLVAYPGFKSAFSDVIGYFYVSSSANKLITELLINKDVDIKTEGLDKNDRKKLMDTADIIIKICGNTSVLINQIVPENFNDYWGILEPLMKPEYQSTNTNYDSGLTNQKKNELFELAVTRDNVGEIMWYLYTGILLISIVQLKISTRGCIANPATMQKNYQTFLDQKEVIDEKNQVENDTVYTIT